MSATRRHPDPMMNLLVARAEFIAEMQVMNDAFADAAGAFADLGAALNAGLTAGDRWLLERIDETASLTQPNALDSAEDQILADLRRARN